MRKQTLLALAISSVCTGLLYSSQALANQNIVQPLPTNTHQQVFNINLPAGVLGDNLVALSKQTGKSISVNSTLIKGMNSAAVKGSYNTQQAINALIINLPLTLHETSANSFTLKAAASQKKQAYTLATTQVVGAQEKALGPVDGYVAKRSATGTKTDTPIIETPQSISVFTADRIEALGASRLTEALSYAPGVNVSPFGDLAQYDWLTLRGFDAYSPGFYLDGMQLRNNGNWGLWLTENYGLERIELLRGPSSVLYG
ncbi:hypothetical protein GCM10009111_06590 [Colwellia asteriadis]|uniref:Secretin/TonB short N-terminal domain-containing protein n=1 Tax=Colwellia asteriadis TaxID=517723 RepID=A0ABP3WGC7_9GAMM